MLSRLKEHRFLLLALAISIAFWLIESFFHMYFFDEEKIFELIPHDFNELWMRIVICLLIMVIGFFADRQIKILNNIQTEKLRTLKATMYNVHDIAGNALNQISLHCDGKKDIQQIISDTVNKLKEISEVDEVVEEKNSQGIRKIKVT